MLSLYDQWERHVVPEPNSGCWLWEGALGHFGYGVLKVQGRQRYAHRLSWILNRGFLSTGSCVLHRCDTPACVNPDHLFVGTKAENMLDKKLKQRCSRISGESIGTSRLTRDQVLLIRDLYLAGEMTQQELGTKFGVHQTQISNILRMKQWRN
jgi:hypothetical protein